jgi:hypothetical protein
MRSKIWDKNSPDLVNIQTLFKTLSEKNSHSIADSANNPSIKKLNEMQAFFEVNWDKAIKTK